MHKIYTTKSGLFTYLSKLKTAAGVTPEILLAAAICNQKNLLFSYLRLIHSLSNVGF